MSVNEQPNTYAQLTSQSRQWFDFLVAETTTLDQTGVHAALLSVRLHENIVSDRTRTQLRTLLSHVLGPTDRVAQTSHSSFSVLLAPQQDLCETVAEVRDIAEALDRAGLRASTGFAHRRASESLLDTWARAEAQLDRAAYRVEHQAGLTL